MAKSANFKFDLQSLLILSNFAKAAGSMYGEYGLLKSVIDKLDTRDRKWNNGSNNSKTLSKSEFILQTATIFMNLKYQTIASSGLLCFLSSLIFFKTNWQYQKSYLIVLMEILKQRV